MVEPLIDSAWGAGADLFDSPLPSMEAIQQGQILTPALAPLIERAWGDVTGRVMGSLVGQWGVSEDLLGDVTGLFTADTWRNPQTWLGVGSGLAVSLSALGAPAAVVSAVPIVGQFVALGVGVASLVVWGASQDFARERPRNESAPPAYSRAGDESWARQLQVAVRLPDHMPLWTGTIALDLCYHPEDTPGCDWGIGVTHGTGSLMPGSGYWPGVWCTPVLGSRAESIAETRPSSSVFADLIGAAYLGDSGVAWSVDADALADAWLSNSLGGLRSMTPNGLHAAGVIDYWPVGEDSASYLVAVSHDDRELLAELLPVDNKLRVAPWPVYRRPGVVSSESRLIPCVRESAQYAGELMVTRPLHAALTALRWKRHQTHLKASTGAAALGLKTQPGYDAAAAQEGYGRLSAYGKTRVRTSFLGADLGHSGGLKGKAGSQAHAKFILPSPP